MIFVTVGTTHFQFDRLLELVAALPTDEELVVQAGPSGVALDGATTVDFLPFTELNDYVRRARVVVSHAGVGSIMVALANGKRPVVVPRLARYGEAVDDHQVDVATMLAQQGRVTLARDAVELGDAVRAAGVADDRGSLEFGPLVAHVAEEVRRAAGGPP